MSDKVSRRTLLTTVGVGAGIAVIATAGQTVPALKGVNIFGPRVPGYGPQNLPVNKTAMEAHVRAKATNPAWQLGVKFNHVNRNFSLADLHAMPQTTVKLPISCVEGWSSDAIWTGVQFRYIAHLIGADARNFTVQSLEHSVYGRTLLQNNFVRDPLTLLALRVNGETLHIDHGYPVRLIAPARPGVFADQVVGLHRSMMKIRIVLWGLGGLLLIFGGYILLSTVAPNKLPGLGIWLFGALLLHDGILSGLLAAGRVMLLPLRKRFGIYLALVQVAVLIGGLLTLLVVPEIFAQLKGPRNSTVVPLPYGLNLFLAWVGISVVLLCLILGVHLVRSRRQRAMQRVIDTAAITRRAEIPPRAQRGGRWARLPVGVGAGLVAVGLSLVGRKRNR